MIRLSVQIGEGDLKVLTPISCSVVGARGYSGLELCRLLLKHPKAELKTCFATQDFDLKSFLHNLDFSKVKCLPQADLFENLSDVVFLATPAEVSHDLAPQILAAGKRVIDLSGAYRLGAQDYSKWYGFEHQHASVLKEAHYGLVPWAGPASPSIRLVANPGCYATAVLMALIPLLKSNLIQADSIVIDAKSGTSGAGKKPTENLLFTEVEGDCLPYKVGRHQHYPEIQQALQSFTRQSVEAHFSTTLLPVRRGLTAAIYARAKAGTGMLQVQQAYKEAYQDYPFVWSAPLQEDPGVLSLRKVVGTADTHIGYVMQNERLYVYSCIDNLLKGAASQAVENLNRMYDLPVAFGLSHLEAQL